MGWVTLSLRKQTLQADINELNFQDIQLSRKIRGVQRHLSYETSVFDSEKSASLKEARTDYDSAKKGRPSRSEYTAENYNGDEDAAKEAYNQAYDEWKANYDEARENYLADKEEIEDEYDDMKEMLEEEAKNQEDAYNDQKTQVETQRDAENAELQALTDEIKSEIESSAIKF